MEDAIRRALLPTAEEIRSLGEALEGTASQLVARERELDDSLGPRLKEAFGGVFIANEKFTKESANPCARAIGSAVSCALSSGLA